MKNTQKYENINTYRTIKMMMERKNSKKEPTINISLACAASSYPQIHRLFEKQKTSSPAKRFRWLYVRVCVLENMWERRKGVYGITPLFSSSFMDFHYHLCALLSEHTRTHTFVHGYMQDSLSHLYIENAIKRALHFTQQQQQQLVIWWGQQPTTTTQTYIAICLRTFSSTPFFEFLCYQTHIHGHCLAF